MPETVSKPNESGKSVDSKNQPSSYFPIFLFLGNPNFIHPSIHPSSIHASSIHASSIHASSIHASSIHPPSILHPPFFILWPSFGVPVVVFGVPFAVLWGSFGVPLGRLGHPWGPFGSPVVSHWGVFWIILVIGRHFPRKNIQTTAPAHKNKPLGILPRLPPAPRLPGFPGSGVRNRCSDPTSTRAGGQDDVS